MARVTCPPAWVPDAVFYQIFPDRFARSRGVEQPSNLEAWDAPPSVLGYKGGDLIGAMERLDYLADLGITAIYFNPIFQSGANHRYHTHDFYSVDPMLGGDEAFAKLLAACHERSIRVVLDGVFNHASRGFFQFNDILENGPASPWREWFHINGYPLRAYGQDEKPNYDAWWGMPALPKFNVENPEVREFLMRVGEHWIRQGIDGWRLDVPQEVTAPGFWEEFRARIRAINEDAYLVGEIWDDASDWIGSGDRFDGAMNYPFTGSVLSFVGGDHLDTSVFPYASYHLAAMDAASYADAIDALLARYPRAATQANLNLLGSHDTPRVRTVLGGQSALTVLATLLLMTFPGAPSVYYGDEIGLGGGGDPDNRAGFPWNERVWDREIYDAVRSLIALRHEHPAFRSGGYRRLWPEPGHEGSSLYVFERHAAEIVEAREENRPECALEFRVANQESLIVAVNPGDRDETATLEGFPGERFVPIWGSATVSAGDGGARVTLAPRTGAVWAVAR